MRNAVRRAAVADNILRGMKVKKLWLWFTSNRLRAEMVKFGYVGIQGQVLAFAIFWLFMDVFKPDINFWVVDTWKTAFLVTSVVCYFHNFFLNKLLGGLKRIGRR